MSNSTGSTFKAGAAKAVITPTEPMWLAGWAVRKEPSRGTISDLYCRALTIEDARGTKLVIVSVDLIALPRWLVDPVASEIETRFDIKREQIIFCASHTHCGPEIRPDKEYFFQIPHEWMEKVPAYNERLKQTMTQVIKESIERLEPAQLFFARATAAFGRNRRKGNDVRDDNVPVLDVRALTGKDIGIVFGYACHNLTLDPQDRRFCGDWSGFACEGLEREFSGTIALFLTGAGADQDPEPRGTLELAQQHGREIASGISKAIRESGRAMTGTIRTGWIEVPLIFQRVTTEQLESDLASDDLPRKRKAQWLMRELEQNHALPTEHPYPIQAVEIGDDFLLIAMSCEPVVEWALNLKRQYSNRTVWVAGYCNDMFCYVPTRRVQAEGGYEGGRAMLWSWVPAPFTEDVEDRVAAGIRQLVSTLQQEEKL